MWAKPSLFAVVFVLLLTMGGRAEAQAQPTEAYPVWLSPSFGLDSLDQIDALLEQPIFPDENEFRLFVGIGKNRRTEFARSCADIRIFEAEGSGALDSPDVYLWSLVGDRCLPIENLREARPAKRSFVRDFVLDADALDYLPAMVTLSPACEELCRLYVANVKRIPWNEYATGEIQNVTVKRNHEFKVETEFDDIEIEILARADFNDDGVEDLYLDVTVKSKEGRWGDSALFFVTRESSDGVLWVLNADKHICSPVSYRPCDTDYDEPPALR